MFDSGVSGEPLRVAIVGVGPKGLYCLERLVARAAESRRRFEIELFEPTGEFGAGAVYSGRQPDCLSMNFADELIDAWPREAQPSADTQMQSYAQWLSARDGAERVPEPSWQGYSPRARVGDYLADCFRTVLDSAPPNVEVTSRVARVETVTREGRRWRLSAGRSERGAAGPSDEVLLALGHNPPRPAPGSIPVSHATDEGLGVDAVPPGAAVRVRGMALTAIDVALLLTEGRGGAFAAGSRPGTLQYLPSGSEPATITLASRSGRLLSVKPDPARFGRSQGVARARRRGLERMGVAAGLDVEAELILELGRTSAELLAALGVVDPDRTAAAAARCVTRLRGRLAGGFEPPARAWRGLRTSLGVAVGTRPPDAVWALGEAWRAVYPAIVERGSHGGIEEPQWPIFGALAREMERVAFGPPPLVGAKLLALSDAGLVRLADRPFEDEGARGDGPLIDAVLAPPGLPTAPSGPLGDLGAAGFLRRAGGGRRGIKVDSAAGCLGADGAPTPGLAAVGRLTEDWVIGNDTLSRRLHAHPDRWAERVVGAS